MQFFLALWINLLALCWGMAISRDKHVEVGPRRSNFPLVRQSPECGSRQCCGCTPYFVRCEIAVPCPGDPESSIQKDAVAGHCCSSSPEGAVGQNSPLPEQPKGSLTTAAPTGTSRAPNSSKKSSDSSENTTTGRETESNKSDSRTCLHTALISRAEVPMRHLVHPAHMWAPMLCLKDDPDACATQHHQVIFAGQVMSMRKACELHLRCFAKEGYVNSVMSHLDLYSNIESGQLQFSHYDHRYPEWTQRLLHLGIWAWRHVEKSR